jgi:hypothetical protein
MRILLALVVFVAAAFAWLKVVGAIGIWWSLRHPPVLPPGTDTYFITSSRVFWLAVILPLFPFAILFWRRVVSRTV